MIECIQEISTCVEACIQEFWDGITVINPDKLILDGDNILCLYLYVIVQGGITDIFAYMKMMDTFSTSYLRSISRFGYCLATLEIALERINSNTIEDLVQIQNDQPEEERSQSFAITLQNQLQLAKSRLDSLKVEDLNTFLNVNSNSSSMHHNLKNRESVDKRSDRPRNASMAEFARSFSIVKSNQSRRPSNERRGTVAEDKALQPLSEPGAQPRRITIQDYAGSGHQHHQHHAQRHGHLRHQHNKEEEFLNDLILQQSEMKSKVKQLDLTSGRHAHSVAL